MGHSLAYCLNKYGVTGYEAENLKALVKKGLSESEAVETAMTDLEKERSAIVKQIQKKLPQYFEEEAEKIMPAKKETFAGKKKICSNYLKKKNLLKLCMRIY